MEEQQEDVNPAIEPAEYDEPEPPTAVAPAWHTAVFIVAVIALSVHSAHRLDNANIPINRLSLYATMAAGQIAMISWVIFGLWLRKVPLRFISGTMRWNPRILVADLCIATIFWLCSMLLLGSFGLMWGKVSDLVASQHVIQPPPPITVQSAPQNFLTENESSSVESSSAEPEVSVQPIVKPSPAKPLLRARKHAKLKAELKPALHSAISAEQRETLETLVRMSPVTMGEMVAWVLLSLLAGCCEELIFRGYLQSQFFAFTRGGIIVAVILTAICFGGGHAYQGLRGMFLIGIFSILFSLLALVRGNLRAGIFAHCWHDLLTGLAVTLLHAHRIF